MVVPYVGTWIEITNINLFETVVFVVPYVGTWIEISFGRRTSITKKVVPYVGTWIEISRNALYMRKFPSRSLRGNVDRNNRVGFSAKRELGRSLRGNVDRNTFHVVNVSDAG